jgi:hypothetical protein
VLRLPGFFHNKAKPYLVTIFEAPGKLYTREQLLKAFPPIEQLPHERLAFVATSSQ